MNKRRGSLLLKLAVLALVLWAAITVVRQRIDIAEATAQRNMVQLEIDRQKRENAQLSALLEAFGDLERIAEAARDELGYVSANEQIFYDVSD